MRAIRPWAIVAPVFLVTVACGGANFTGLESADAASPEDGDKGPDAVASADAPSGVDAPNPPPQPDGSVSADATSLADASPTACPDVTGAYTIDIGGNSNCGDLNDKAPQCIRAGQPAGGCDVLFTSFVNGGGASAINGAAAIQGDGSFSGAALREGTANRTGCTGTWNAAASTMTVDCGGSGSSQSCVVTLTRTGQKCG